MSRKISNTPLSPLLDEEAYAEFVAIRSLLSIRSRFVLASVVCDDVMVQRNVVGELLRECKGLTIVELSPDSSDPFTTVDQTAPVDCAGLLVVGLTRWLSREETRKHRATVLNATRERWAERFRCPVLIWMNRQTATFLGQDAPDFWRYRSHRFELSAVKSAAGPRAPVGGFGRDGEGYAALPADRAAERIAELRQRLSSMPLNAEPSLLAAASNWRNELARHLYQLGDLDSAERLLRESLEIERRFGHLEGQANALGNLGIMVRVRGQLDESERLHREALEIEKRLGRLQGQASDLGNLGLIALARGDLDAAERLHAESLEIERKLGNLPGVASDLGNLGVVALTRGDLEKAERLHRESLKIETELRNLEGQANALGNLGIIAHSRGDFDGAENLLRQSLDIEKNLGRLEGQANALGNLALIAQHRGDLDRAEHLHRESLEIERQLGRLEGQAADLGNLGVISHLRGDIDEAERLHRESLEMERVIGHLEGQGAALANLGTVALARGDKLTARRLWIESRDLFGRIGIPQRVQDLQKRLDSLSRESHDTIPGDARE